MSEVKAGQPETAIVTTVKVDAASEFQEMWFRVIVRERLKLDIWLELFNYTLLR